MREELGALPVGDALRGLQRLPPASREALAREDRRPARSAKSRDLSIDEARDVVRRDCRSS